SGHTGIWRWGPDKDPPWSGRLERRTAAGFGIHSAKLRRTRRLLSSGTRGESRGIPAITSLSTRRELTAFRSTPRPPIEADLAIPTRLTLPSLPVPCPVGAHTGWFLENRQRAIRLGPNERVCACFDGYPQGTTGAANATCGSFTTSLRPSGRRRASVITRLS